ncbi:MAG: MBL fold metallo-hydrolase, partial [Burkholderiaceae bacterium]|nr:MBL fold metallo-hydrolase [Burkholderiaceae bacterium]
MKALEALFRLIQGVALILWLALWPLPAALAQDAPVMRTVQVSPSAWYVEGLSALGSTANQNFVSNAAFVVTPAGVVVIDALGSPALAERLLQEIRKLTRQPVTHV